MRRHPSTDTLSQYLDGELDPQRRARTAAHLADCPACRARLQDWRTAGQAIREGAIPELSTNLFNRIQSRSAEGERIILPVADPAPPRRERRLILAIAAAVLFLVIGSGLFLGAPDLKADASELRFSPAEPTAGEQIEAEYRASSLLSNEDRVVLRARYRTREDWAYNDRLGQVVVAELTRNKDGVFRGSFRLPDSVVYAVFAVEDPAANKIDSNSRQGWELLIHGSDRCPLFEALEQRANDLMGRNWELAHATARTAAELYPERVQSWNILRFFQEAVLGESGMDSLRAVHQESLQRFHDTLSGVTASGDDAGSMFFYAWALGDTITRDFWRDRLAKEHPEHPLAVQNRIVFDLAPKHRSDPAVLLAEMDRMWGEIGPAHDQQGIQGFSAARRVGDPEAILRWADRYLHFRPNEIGWVASKLVELPALREEGLHRLREEIRRIAAMRQEDRGLFATAEDQRRNMARELRVLYGVLGKVLLASGQTQAGLDALALAVAAGWDTRLFREVAEARLTAGDTTGAVELWAKIAVDPATSASFADSIQDHIGGRFDGPRWRALSAEARGMMRREVLADATNKSIRGRVRLIDAGGKEHALGDLAGNQPTLVIFWSRFCGPALEALPEVERVAKRLSGQGARVVAITDEEPSPELSDFLRDKGLSVPVYHDTRREAARAFGSWGTPEYFVLDDTGRIRFEHSSLSAIERQVTALSAAES